MQLDTRPVYLSYIGTPPPADLIQAVPKGLEQRLEPHLQSPRVSSSTANITTSLSSQPRPPRFRMTRTLKASRGWAHRNEEAPHAEAVVRIAAMLHLPELAPVVTSSRPQTAISTSEKVPSSGGRPRTDTVLTKSLGLWGGERARTGTAGAHSKRHRAETWGWSAIVVTSVWKRCRPPPTGDVVKAWEPTTSRRLTTTTVWRQLKNEALFSKLRSTILHSQVNY